MKPPSGFQFSFVMKELDDGRGVRTHKGDLGDGMGCDDDLMDIVLITQ